MFLTVRCESIGTRGMASTLWMLLAMAIAILLVGCLADRQKLPEVPLQEANSCPFFTNDGGLRIGAAPLFEPDRQRTYFGTNLLDKRILPVLMVITNDTAKDGFLLMKNETQLLLAESGQPNNNSEAKLQSEAYPTYPDSGMYRGLSSVIVEISPLYRSIAEKDVRDTFAVNSQIGRVAMVPRTVYPRSSVYGMLYFMLPRSKDAAKVDGFVLKGQYVRTGKSIEFTIRRKEKNR